MADFMTSFKPTIAFEGGYSNNPNDAGGETYKGISRRNWGSWKGWDIIDTYKKSNLQQLNQLLEGNIQLQELVQSFYNQNFWKPILGDMINDQRIANNIYDFAVNSGVNRAIRYAQSIVGVVQDGLCGNKTISAINSYNTDDFISKYKTSRIAFLNKIVQNNPSQSMFIKGWTSRAENA